MYKVHFRRRSHEVAAAFSRGREPTGSGRCHRVSPDGAAANGASSRGALEPLCIKSRL
jgi:hypothetical protein